jgi:hypothetical protein
LEAAIRIAQSQPYYARPRFLNGQLLNYVHNRIQKTRGNSHIRIQQQKPLIDGTVRPPDAPTPAVEFSYASVDTAGKSQIPTLIPYPDTADCVGPTGSTTTIVHHDDTNSASGPGRTVL